MIRGIDEPLWKEIPYKLWRKIERFFRKIWYVIKWMPYIWRDENWDHWNMWQILKTKLMFDKKYYEKADIIVKESYEKIVKEIDFTIKLIERIQEDDYHFVAEKRLFGSLSKHEMIESEDFPGSIEIKGGRSSEEFQEILNLSNELRDRDFKILHNLLKNNSQGWWD